MIYNLTVSTTAHYSDKFISLACSPFVAVSDTYKIANVEARQSKADT